MGCLSGEREREGLMGRLNVRMDGGRWMSRLESALVQGVV